MTVTSNPIHSLVDFYDLLGIDRDLSTATIRENLADERVGWASKAARASSKGDEARERIALIDEAAAAFADDDAREQYELALAAQRRQLPELSEEEKEEKIDWLVRAWSYYFRRDDGPAMVAARKAREQDPNDAMGFVVSSWVNLRDNEIKRAKQDADEAFVLDELGEDTTDVHHVRGAVQAALNDHERAVTSYDRALAKTSGAEQIEILMRRADSLTALRRDSEAQQSCQEAYATRGDLREPLTSMLHETSVRSVLAPATRPSDRNEYQVEPVRAVARAFRDGSEHSQERASVATELEAFVARVERWKTLYALKNPGTDDWGFPLKSLAIGVFCLLLGQASSIFILIALAAFVWAGFGYYKHTEKKKSVEEFERTRQELARVSTELTKDEARALGGYAAAREISA